MLAQTVTVCTRFLLVAKTVMGTVCAAALEDAVSVSVELPLTSEDGLKEALTPEGSPEAERSIAPKPNDRTCSGIASVPPDMVYPGIYAAALCVSTLKSR